MVREAQELVEPALKAMLREIGIDPPKWHDFGPILLEHAQRFPEATRQRLLELARISKWLRKERELSFYGDIDFVPTEEYFERDASGAVTDALYALEAAQRLVQDKRGPSANADSNAPD